MIELPNKKSEVLEFALAQIELVEENPNIIIDNNYFINVTEDNKCTVCVAGGLILMLQGVDATKDIDLALIDDPEFKIAPSHFSSHNHKCLKFVSDVVLWADDDRLSFYNSPDFDGLDNIPSNDIDDIMKLLTKRIEFYTNNPKLDEIT
jgi:hypothetical protein